MANEITVTAKLSANKGSTAVSNATSSFTIDMAGAQMYHANPEISTTAAALSCSPVDQTARYWLFVRNQDSTNEVWLSFNGGSTYPVIVLPGESFGPVLVAASQTLWADAQTAACICEVVAVEA